MAHIQLPEGIPGILGPMAFSPETARPLNALAEVLLRAPNSLPEADREMIATYVSSQNDCYFCQSAHGAAHFHFTILMHVPSVRYGKSHGGARAEFCKPVRGAEER